MEKPKWLKTLRFWSRLTSIVIVIVFSFLIFIMIALLNDPSFSEYFEILSVGSIYLIGVLISFFREGLGGISTNITGKNHLTKLCKKYSRKPVLLIIDKRETIPADFPETPQFKY